MGGRHGKSSAREVARESSDESDDMGGGTELWPGGAHKAAQDSEGTSVCSRLRDWKSVRRTVNDLYQDGKHAFSFSPARQQNFSDEVFDEDEKRANRRSSNGHTPLTSLVYTKDVDAVRDFILNPGVDVNYPEAQLYCGYRWDFYPPLIVAINCEDTEMVRLLLLSGASVNCRDSQGFSALYHASKLGNEDIVSLLLNFSPELTAPPVEDSYTITDPLQIACCHGHLGVSKLLIKAGRYANDSEFKSNLQPSLDHALNSENEALCLLLLENGAKMDQKLFFKACLYGCENVVKYMINSGINVRDSSLGGENALMYALSAGCLGRLKRKLSCADGRENARRQAYEILQHTVNIIHLLCLNGCDLDLKERNSGATVLYQSLHLQNLPAVIALLKHGASFQLDSNELHIADVNDDVFIELCDLYLTFVAPQIPQKVIFEGLRRRKTARIASLNRVHSLQHLCRLTIRKRLKRCRKYSSSVLINMNEMKIPRMLKNYLCYSEIDELSSNYCDILFCLSWSARR